jgi:hypothetical protein
MPIVAVFRLVRSPGHSDEITAEKTDVIAPPAFGNRACHRERCARPAPAGRSVLNDGASPRD